MRAFRRVVTPVMLACVLVGAPAASAAPGWVPPTVELQTAPFSRAVTAVSASGRSVVASADREPVSGGVSAVVVRVARREPGAAFVPGPVVSDNAGAPARDARVTAVAIAGDGSALVLWRFEYQLDRNQLRARTIAPDGTLGEIQDLTPGTGEDVSGTDVFLASNRDGQLALVFGNQARTTVWATSGSTTAGLRTPQQVSAATITTAGTAAIDAAGNAVVTWQRTNAPGRSAVEVTTKTAAETTFPLPQRFIGGAPDDDARTPVVAMTPGGRTMLAYTSTVAGRPLTYEVRDTVTGAWSAPASAAQPGQVIGGDPPALALTPAGTAVIAYRDAGGRLNTAARTGSTFGGYQQLVTTSGRQSLVAGPDGTVLLVIAQDAPSVVLGSVLRPGATAFGDPVRVGGTPAGSTNQEGPASAGVDDEGNAYGLLSRYRCPTGTSPCSVPDVSELVGFGYDGAAPALGDVAAPADLVAGAAGTFTATATDRASAVTLSWAFDDGATAQGASVTHAFATAGDHAATVTATDAVGNATSATRTVRVSALPVPGAPAGPAPAGPAAPVAPATPTRKPSKRRAGTGSARFRVRAGGTTVTSLVARALPRGARVTLACTGRGCPLRSRTVRVRKATRRLVLTARVAGAVLRPGATLTLTIRATGRRTTTTAWTVRKGRPPRRR